MPVQPIRLFGDPVLRTPAEPVVDFDKELRTLVKDLQETMLDAPGVGLAAPQIGVGLRVFTYHVDDVLGHLVNPTLDLTDETVEDDEGCLSFPGLAYPCLRAYGVVAKGFDMHGEPVTLEGTELLARCVQHETDHLDGILFIDRLDKAQRKAALKAIREAEWAGETAPAGQALAARDARPSALSAPSMRLVFAGTPEVAVPSLDALLASSPRGRRRPHPAGRPVRPRPAGGRVAGRPAGRRGRRRGAEAGRRLATPRCATGCSSSRRTAARWSRTARWCRPRCSTCRPHGWVNLHFSLLPAWRGAAPVQHAILHGDDVTGASMFTLEEGLDTGPVLRLMTEPIRPARHQRRPARPARDRGRRPAGGHPRRARARRAGGRAAAGRRRQPRAEADRRGRPGRLVGAGLPRRPAGPGLHARAGRLDHLGRRAARPRPGRAVLAAARGADLRRSRPVRCPPASGQVLVGTGDGQAVAARRGATGRAQADGGGRLGPRRARLDGGTLSGDRPAAEGPAAPSAAQGRAAAGPAAPGRVRPAARGGRAATPTPTSTLPALLRERGPARPRDAGVRHRAGLRHAARPRDVRRRAGRLRRPAAGPGRPAGARRAAARRPPAARACGCPRTPRSARPSSWPARSPARAAASFVNAVLRKVGEQRPRRLAGEPSRRRTTPTRSATSRSCTRTRAGSSRRCATRSAARWSETAALLGRRQRAAAGDAGRPPGRATVDELRRGRRRGRPLVAVRRGAARRRPGRASPRCGRAGPACRTRAASSSRSRWPRRRWTAPTQRWLDLCAGPGGKAALLGALAGRRGGRLLAAEVAPHRAGAGRAGVVGGHRRPSVVGRRPGAGLARRRAFDRVLVDAPCTGLGALRRRPEARWRRQPRGRRRADRAAARPAARRRWTPSAPAGWSPTSPARRTWPRPAASCSTCCTAAGRRRPVERVDARPYLPGVPDLGDGPDVQLWPHRARHRRDVPRAAASRLSRSSQLPLT